MRGEAAGNGLNSAFDDYRFVVANSLEHALEQFWSHPIYIVSRAGVPSGAQDDFVFVYTMRNEITARNNVAAAEKFFHIDLRRNRGQEGEGFEAD